MLPALAAFADAHGLSPAAVEALERALAAGVADTVEASESVFRGSGVGARTLAPRAVGGDGGGGAGAGVAVPVAPAPLAARYDDLGFLARGGMGEVRRVRDRVLNRELALKVVHAPILHEPALLARFIEEAQATAQLEHPAIVPVHDLGQLPDGRVWFTMKVVHGRTLAEVIRTAHAAASETGPLGGDDGGLRPVIVAFHAVCQAVAFAHDRGVVHRDLKPENVMVGAFGEVYVLDWGLAKITGRPDLPAAAGALGAGGRGREAHPATRQGQVAGTPSYMAPEQAHGEVDLVDARSDVYSLGAMLYEILAGRPPYLGAAREVVHAVRAGPPPAVEVVAPAGRALPAALVVACTRALAREPSARFPSATALAEAVAAHLDGSQRRAQALAVVAEAARRVPEAAAWRDRARALRAEAEAALAGVAPHQPEADKAAAWAREDEALACERRAAHAEFEEEQLLQAALTHASDLPEAHAALASRYRALQAVVEDGRGDTSRLEALWRNHAEALPLTHAARAEHLSALRGDGALTLLSDPPGARVRLHRFVRENRRLVARFERDLGPAPLHAIPLPMGSYLCTLHAPGRAVVRYPVFIGRGAHWDGVPPDGGGPAPVWLPPEGALGGDDVYVPAGWFWAGGDADAMWGTPRRRVWVDAFVLRRFPFTHAECIAVLNAMVAAGRVDDALRFAPRDPPVDAGRLGALRYTFDGQAFHLPAAAATWGWEPATPVTLVDWPSAAALCAHVAAQTGQPWRLPGELEWEKAARGVDGRFFPWGDWLDPAWACIRDSHAGERAPAPIGAFPVDESVYGVRGLAGNTRDWCVEPYTAGGPAPTGGRAPAPETHGPAGALGRTLRGGSWDFAATTARLANRYRCQSDNRYDYLGFRLARAIGPGRD